MRRARSARFKGYSVGVGHASSMADGIEVMFMRLDALTEGDQHRLASFLDQDEVERAESIRSARVRRQYIATRATARVSLALRTGQPLQQIRFREGVWGKPYLDAMPGQRTCDFNISHSDRYVAIALGQPATSDGQSRSGSIGLDIETHQQRLDIDAVASCSLTDHEHQTFQSLSHHTARRAYFLRSWTLKEAVLKSVGTGLVTDLKQIFCDLPPERSAFSFQFSPQVSAESMLAWQAQIDTETVLSLAVPKNSGINHVRVRQLFQSSNAVESVFSLQPGYGEPVNQFPFPFLSTQQASSS